MAARLQKQLDADPDDEEGVTPDGMEYLEEFLQELTENILDRHKMRCPLVQASDTGEIVLVWRKPSDIREAQDYGWQLGPLIANLPES